MLRRLILEKNCMSMEDKGRREGGRGMGRREGTEQLVQW